MSHHHHDPKNLAGKMLFSVLLNILITVVQIIGGIISGSLALISDALHNLTDAVALVISYIAIWLQGKAKTEERTFGYQRAEILAALFNASLLIIISFFLLKEAIFRLLSPAKVDSLIMMSVAGVGLLANALTVVLLHGDKKRNLNVRAAYLHMLSDAVTSLGVILGGLCILVFRFFWIDSLLTIGIVIYTLKEGYGIVSDAVGILMHNTPQGISVKKIEHELLKIKEIKNIHHVHVWQMTEDNIHFEAHVELKRDLATSETCQLKEAIEDILHEKFDIEHCTIQFEYGVCKNIGLVKQC